MNIQTLRERRTTTVDSLKSINELAGTEQRDLNPAEQTQFETLRGELNSLDGQIERAVVVADAERSMQPDPNQPRRGNDGTFEQACRSFSVTKAIADRLEPGQVDAGREREISGELATRSGRKPSGFFVPHEVFEQRAVTAGGSGGNLVQTAHRADLYIDRLRAALKVQTLGATILDGLVGNQEIPRLTGSAAGYWVAEHGAVTPSDQVYDQVPLAPKTVGAEVEYSRRMMINASPSIENLVRGDLANVVATAIDHASINADGTGNLPLGILNTPSINTIAFVGSPTWAGVLEHIAKVNADNALAENMGWLTNAYAVQTMRSTVRVASTDSNFIMDGPNELAGYQMQVSSQVPGEPVTPTPSTLIFANWQDLLIGYWSAVDILVNPYHADVYSKGGVKINALQDCDIAVRHPESFCVSTDMTV